METKLPSQSVRQTVSGLDKLHDGIHLMLGGEFLKQNPGMLDRYRFRTPSNILEKVDLLDRLRKAEIKSHVF